MSNDSKKRKYKIMVDQKRFDVSDQFITGIQIKALVNAPSNYGVWLKVNVPEDDLEIADSDRVDLNQPGREHFFTGSKTTTEG